MHQNDAAASLGTAIRIAREEQGLRQDELALAAGVSVRTVHQVESGKPTSRLDVVLRILRALGLTFEILPAPRRRPPTPEPAE
jgi:HTH-type transcriptional regulator/antitoxin HipB